MTGAKNTPPHAFGSTTPGAGEPMAAYRAALAKVEPGEAFLARTRRALAEASGLADKTGGAPRGQAAGAPQNAGETYGAARKVRPSPRPGMPPRTVRRTRLAPLQRCLLPAACLALLLLAVPAGGLLGGGASLSGGAASQAADQALTARSSAAAAVAEDTAEAEDTTAETVPTEEYAAPAGEPGAAPEPAPGDAPAAADMSPADNGDTPNSARDLYNGAGAPGEETDGVSPANGTSGGNETHKETGDAPLIGSDAGSEGAASAEEGGSEEPPVSGLTRDLNKRPAGIAAERIRAA